MTKNQVFVTTKLDDNRLWTKTLQLTDLHWINSAPESGQTYQVRTRYRAPLVNCTISLEGNHATFQLTEEARAITPGQSAVIHNGNQVVGGGIVI